MSNFDISYILLITIVVIAVLVYMYVQQMKQLNILAKQNEAKDRENEQYELIFNTTPEMIWLKDTKNRIVNLNKLAAASSGGTVEALRGASVYDLHPQEADKYYQDDLEVIRSRRAMLGIIERFIKDGEKLWIRTAKYPIFDDSDKNNVIGILVIAADITQQKDMQDALNRNQYILSEAQRIGHIGLWEYEITKDVIRVSTQAAEILGCEQTLTNDAFSKFLSLVHPDDRLYLSVEHEKALEEKTKFRVTYRLKAQDHIAKTIRQECECKYDDDCNAVSSIGIIHDITEIKRLEHQTLQAQSNLAHAERVNTLGKLSSSIAHEINQPLSAINQFCTSAKLRMQNSNYQDEKLFSYLDGAIDQSLRAGEIIRRLRQLIEKRQIDKSLANINTLIHECVEMMSSEIELNAINLQLELQTNISEILIDSIQIQQVVINVLRNSINAMSLYDQIEPLILVKSYIAENNSIEVSIEDNGPGIKEERKQSLFLPYVSYQENSGENEQGLGLGLSICQTIINAHDGEIWIDEEYNDGAKIIFTLPNETS